MHCDRSYVEGYVEATAIGERLHTLVNRLDNSYKLG